MNIANLTAKKKPISKKKCIFAWQTDTKSSYEFKRIPH